MVKNISVNEVEKLSGVADICAIIPSLNPDEKFLTVVEALVNKGFQNILIIDDGSKQENQTYFDKVMRYPQCTVIRHARNLGKGRALKTAFNYYLTHFSHLKGVVTLDGDNQHHIDDIIGCTECLIKNKNALVLGARDFKVDNIPLKSRLGNVISIFVLNALCGIKVSDTQTGLRAMSNELVSLFLDLPGERFEFETNMLIETKKRLIPIEEIKIRTVYIEDNKSSHFNPLLDSVRIYALILKYLSSSIGSFVIDLSLFSIVMMILSSYSLEIKISVSTIVSRVISSLFNYFMNYRFVFQSDRTVYHTIKKYYLLALIQMAISMGGVYLLAKQLNINSTVIKVFVDVILFFISFQIQREWVFKNTGKSNK